MKQTFLLITIAALAGLTAAKAQDAEKLMLNAGSIEHIKVENDMNIVLLPGTSGDGEVSLDPASSGRLNIAVSNNLLSISATGAHNPTVYLYVTNLKTLTVQNNSTVRTVGILSSPLIEVYVDGRARIHLATRGLVKAYSLDDSEIAIHSLTAGRASAAK